MRRRVAVLATVGVVLSFGLSTSTGSAGAKLAATPLPWAIVFQHVDPALGDVTGLDILRSGDQRAHALTRRRPGADDRDNGAVWSPDGRRVAFARFYSHWGLYVVDELGGAARRLATGSDEALAWSPDGMRVAFSRHCSSSRRTATCRPGVYVAFIDGRPIARVFPSEGTPSWSPDGRRIVCRCASRVYVFAADGSNRRRLSRQADGPLGAASWSPDGSLIAFGRHCTPGLSSDVFCDIAVMRPDGSGDRTVLRHHGISGPSTSPPAWLADGRLLVDESGDLHQIVAVDPHSGMSRVVYHDVGTSPVPGPADSFGLLTQGTSSSWILVIADKAGRVLVRHQLPDGADGDASLRVG